MISGFLATGDIYLDFIVFKLLYNLAAISLKWLLHCDTQGSTKYFSFNIPFEMFCKECILFIYINLQKKKSFYV